MLNRKNMGFFCVVYLTVITFSNGIFFLPALPWIGNYFHVSRSEAQLAYPIVIIGASIGYAFFGALSDYYGTKKILIISVSLFFLSNIICMICNSFEIFLFGLLVGGFSSFYFLLIRYINVDLHSDSMRLLSVSNLFGLLGVPIFSLVSSFLIIFDWRYIFLLWVVICFFGCLTACFLPIKKSTSLNKFHFKNVLHNINYIFSSRLFYQSFFCVLSIRTAKTLFYTLTPHILIVDLGVPASTFSSYLFITILCSMIGDIITSPLRNRFGEDKCIFIGKIICLFGGVLFLIAFHFFTYALVYMITFGVIMLGSPLISNNGYMDIAQIKASLAGSALSILAIGLNVVSGGIGLVAAKRDGINIGILILLVLLIGFSLHFILSRQNANRPK